MWFFVTKGGIVRAVDKTREGTVEEGVDDVLAIVDVDNDGREEIPCTEGGDNHPLLKCPFYRHQTNPRR